MSKLDQFFMTTAQNLSKMSHCISYKVGCVIVEDNRIISMGYNGTISGFTNCIQHFGADFLKPVMVDFIDKPTEAYYTARQAHNKWSNTHEIHAQMNAILFAVKHGIKLDGTRLYTTVFPCQQCIKNIIQSGIRQVIYAQTYDKAVIDQQMLDFAKQFHKFQIVNINEV